MYSDLVNATQRLIRWADTWQLTLAADKCTVCRLAQPRWLISWDHNTPEYKVNVCLFHSVFRSRA